MPDLPAKFLKHICAEVASCAVLWPLALSDFCWRYNQANLLPKQGIFTLLIFTNYVLANKKPDKANIHHSFFHLMQSESSERSSKAQPSIPANKVTKYKIIRVEARKMWCHPQQCPHLVSFVLIWCHCWGIQTRLRSSDCVIHQKSHPQAWPGKTILDLFPELPYSDITSVRNKMGNDDLLILLLIFEFCLNLTAQINKFVIVSTLSAPKSHLSTKKKSHLSVVWSTVFMDCHENST